MLEKINKNITFLNEYNFIVELENNFKVLDLKDFQFIIPLLNNNQLKILLRYFNYNMVENVLILLKNIAYKKQKELLNYCENGIKF